MVQHFHDVSALDREYYYYPVNIEKYVYSQAYMYDPYLYVPPTYDGYTTHHVAPEQRFVQQFLDEHGQVNIEKLLKTIGQLANTIQQVSPVFKQLNELVRNIRAIQTVN